MEFCDSARIARAKDLFVGFFLPLVRVRPVPVLWFIYCADRVQPGGLEILRVALRLQEGGAIGTSSMSGICWIPDQSQFATSSAYIQNVVHSRYAYRLVIRVEG